MYSLHSCSADKKTSVANGLTDVLKLVSRKNTGTS